MECRDSCMEKECRAKGTEKAEPFTVKEGGMETEDEKEEENESQEDATQEAWRLGSYLKVDKEIHYYAGHEITIWKSSEPYSATVWPAALALCQYLETNQRAVNLQNKAVLEIGAGTGLVSIVASLLGAWVTASDLPEVLGNLRGNLSINTRGRCRYTPQVAELTWGYNLKCIFPHSIYRYDYVLAADVVYNHNFLAELLETMCHFCQPGTTLILSNKIHFASELTFLENFKEVFNTTLLADLGEIKIYSATMKELQRNLSGILPENAVEEEEENTEENLRDVSRRKRCEGQELDTCASITENSVTGKNNKDQEQITRENIDIEGSFGGNDTNCQVEPKDEDDGSSFESEKPESHDCNAQLTPRRPWEPTVYYSLDKEIHYFMGHTITVQESIDSYGGMIWPAAVALLKFLETAAGQEQIKLMDKETLELGAGTGLLSVAALLLGAKLTATDLPELLSNLRYNLNRNTRGHRRHEPQVAALSWGHELEQSFPRSEFHFDYVLAADVVYHHSFLDELLVTMQYFCQPGTNLIWANKIRFTSDQVFVENFQKAFHATLIAELDEVRIYLGTYRAPGEEEHLTKRINQEEKMEEENNDWNNEKRNEKEELKKHEHNQAKEESENLPNHADYPTGQNKQTEKDNSCIHVDTQIDSKKSKNEASTLQQKEEDGEHEPQKEEDEEEENTIKRNTEDAGKEEESQACNETCLAHTEEKSDCLETEEESVYRKAWEPNIYFTPGKEIHYFLGEKISIEESFDSYGAMIWPAAVALCKFLETPASLQHINLLNKSVLEIGAGTGLLSIVATLLGAKLTATDLPEVLSNLRYNLNRNTRSLRRHEPQIKELSWGHKLEESFPHSTHHYDYVLAADVVYHHSFLDELLVTMQHFCQPGTNLIWANKVRYPSDLVFIENFKKVFHATLIAELDEVRIYLGTYRAPGEEEHLMKSINQEQAMEEENNDWKDVKMELNKQKDEEGKQKSETQENQGDEQNPARERTENKKDYNSSIDEDIDTDTKKRQSETVMLQQTEEDEEPEPQNDINDQEENEGEKEPEDIRNDEESQACSESKPTSSALPEEKSDCLETKEESVYRKAWEPNIYFTSEKEIHYFLGEKISIEESFDSYGAMIWPAAVALCKFLETPASLQHINLLNKSVLEIGAGTGLLSIVATLLGAKLTATDLPEVLSNLRYNLNRNTRSLRRHEPQIKELSWGHKLEESFPHSTHHYDYVLAADVVYHHSFLDELLVTMQHFCQPGTNLIWANKVRYPSDLVFIENFKKVFHATLIAELDEVRIYKGTHKCVVESNVINKDEEVGDEEEEKGEEEDEKEEKNEAYKEAEEDHHGEPQDSGGQQPSTGEAEKLEREKEPAHHRSDSLSGQQLSKETYYFVGHKISIEESSDFHGGLRRPAALGLCKFLDTSAGRQKFKLLDKSVLELGAGPGIVSTVAALLGAEVTATDTPEILGGLRNNLNQNTRHSRRYEPQVAPLSWGQDLECTFPHSEFHFDYVLAADVVYNHDFLDELLVTMRYFCQPGTTLIWANKVRNSSELDFTEHFTKVFHATLVAELDEVKIYSATTKECGNREELAVSEEAIKKSNFNTTLFEDSDEGIHEEENIEKPHSSVDNGMAQKPEERIDDVQHEVNIMKHHGGEIKAEGLLEETEVINGSSETKKNMGKQKRGYTEIDQGMTDEDEEDEEETLRTKEVKGSTGRKSSGNKEASSATDRRLCEERHFFAGHEIRITDSLEPYGPTVRPAAVALCKFLETNKQRINLKSKAVLELGAGTGLVSVVASLLGAWVTATDKAVVLDNLSSNLSRNTRGLCKYTPQVEALSWKDNLFRSFPRTTYRYDIVLAADVVYQHDLLNELLTTMRHFCQPGTILIWCNTIRTQTETIFSERFRRAFATTLLAEMGEVKIYMAKTHSQR